MNTPLYSLDSKVYRATVLKRPSTSVKSPYVADIIIDGQDEPVLAHTPALGCCGLADAGARVIVTQIPEKKSGKPNVCKWRIQQSIVCDDRTETPNTDSQRVIGIAPKLAEHIAESALSQNLVDGLNVHSIAREKTIGNSRFDFVGTQQNGTYFICEVKNVPLADFEDITAKERKTRNYCDTSKWKWDDKIAYFPDGYRKNAKEPVSPRALKHVQELTRIQQQLGRENVQCVMLYIIQRTDVSRFQASIIDPIYKEALKTAHNAGVLVKTIMCEWNDDVCSFVSNNIEIII